MALHRTGSGQAIQLQREFCAVSVSVRDFRRDDRDQVTWLVNLHLSTVLPGVALSTNVVLAQLEREPGETIVDPWVAERRCLVAESEQNIIGAALLLRYADRETVGEAYRGAAEIRWLVGLPNAPDTCRSLLDEVIELMRRWNPSHIYADGALPAPGCYGIPDSWPHVRRLLVEAGFDGPARAELVLAAPCAQLVGHGLIGTSVKRSVGYLGARLELEREGTPLGFIEVGEISQALSRSTSASSWTDVGNLSATPPQTPGDVMPALLSAAADWLLLGGVDRLIDYYAEDIEQPEYLAILERCGFTRLSTNERGWELKI
jgi:hypothetical protein